MCSQFLHLLFWSSFITVANRKKSDIVHFTMCQNIIVRVQVSVGTVPKRGVNNLFQIFES